MRFDFFTGLHPHEGGLNLSYSLTKAYFNSTMFEFFFGVRSQIFLKGGEHFFTHFYQDHPRIFGRELMVIMWQKMIEKIAKGACGLNAGGPGANDHEIQDTVLN